MTLPIHKAPLQNVCGSFGEYAMRLVSRFKDGCEQLIRSRSLVQHRCRKLDDPTSEDKLERGRLGRDVVVI